MNKLKEYRELGAEEFKETSDLPGEPDFHWKKGFDAAVSLNLPVKFTEWKEKNCYYRESNFHELKSYGDRQPIATNITELYKYWLDNIYDPNK